MSTWSDFFNQRR